MVNMAGRGRLRPAFLFQKRPAGARFVKAYLVRRILPVLMIWGWQFCFWLNQLLVVLKHPHLILGGFFSGKPVFNNCQNHEN